MDNLQGAKEQFATTISSAVLELLRSESAYSGVPLNRLIEDACLILMDCRLHSIEETTKRAAELRAKICLDKIEAEEKG